MAQALSFGVSPEAALKHRPTLPLVLMASLIVLKLHHTFLINPFHWVKSFYKAAQPLFKSTDGKTKDRDSHCLL